MCTFKILSITHKIIILRKPKYLNKLLNEELMRNMHAILKYNECINKSLPYLTYGIL